MSNDSMEPSARYTREAEEGDIGNFGETQIEAEKRLTFAAGESYGKTGGDRAVELVGPFKTFAGEG